MIRACLKTDCYLNFRYTKRKTGVIMMSSERYELADVQWDQIKD